MKQKSVAKVLLALAIVLYVVGLYVNYTMPHGPVFATGDVVCLNDGQGPCSEAYKEEMRNLPIPAWAKAIREYGFLLIFGLSITAICLWREDGLPTVA